MKIYCSCCDKVQPVHIDNCRDAKTHEPFQDIVCKECYLVIASGTDIQRKPLTDEEWQVIADTLDCLITRKQKDAIEAVIGIKEEA